MKTPFHFLALLSVLGLGLVLSPGQAPVAQAGLARLFFLKGTLSDFDGVEIRITDHWGRTWAFPRKLLSAGLELRPGSPCPSARIGASFVSSVPTPGKRRHTETRTCESVRS